MAKPQGPWKIKSHLCRCCFSEGEFTPLSDSCATLHRRDTYSIIFLQCYDIELMPVVGPLSDLTYSICDSCINKLTEAMLFKQQVLDAEKRFQDLYSRNVLKAAVPTIEIEIKAEPEPIDEDSSDDFNIPGFSDEDQIVKEEDIDCDVTEHGITTLKTMETDEQMPSTSSTSMKTEDILPSTSAVPFVVPHTTPTARTNAQRQHIVKPSAKTTETAQRKTMPVTKKKTPVAKKKRPVTKKKNAKKKDSDPNTTKKTPTPRNLFHLKFEDFEIVDNLFVCKHCQKKYKGRVSLRTHVKKCHYPPQLKCPACPEKFKSVIKRVVHKFQVHNIDDRVRCNACDHIFNSKIQLQKHNNIFHMLGEKYKCDSCEYETYSFEGLYKHKYKHKKVKDYHCRFCKKSFLRKSNRDLHERIHTGDRRKVCSECGQAFVQKASLNYHMAKHHPAVQF